MLRSRPEQLKLGIGGARCVDEQLATKRKGIELVRNAQAFKLERGVNASHYTQVRNIGSSMTKGASGWAGRNKNSRRLIWVTRV